MDRGIQLPDSAPASTDPLVRRDFTGLGNQHCSRLHLQILENLLTSVSAVEADCGTDDEVRSTAFSKSNDILIGLI